MRIRMTVFTGLVAVCAWLAAGAPVAAWTRPGHMVVAAIAYDDLVGRDPRIIDRIIDIMSHHPERAPFEVAIGRAIGPERTRRIWLETARWPDDVRGGAQDHPTWHGAFRPVIDPRDPPPIAPPAAVVYDAYEALALNAHMAAEPRAPAADRAVALCWIFHVVGDIHQPLHTAELYSGRFPDGDRYGSLEFLLDPNTGQPVSLHWFWDDLVHRQGEPDTVFARARDLETRWPRARFAGELAKTTALQAAVQAWSDESYALARSLAYRHDRPRAASAAEAKPPSAAYVADATVAAEQRAALAGYRLADLLRRIFPPA
jgi:hypothetical protein